MDLSDALTGVGVALCVLFGLALGALAIAVFAAGTLLVLAFLLVRAALAIAVAAFSGWVR